MTNTALVETATVTEASKASSHALENVSRPSLGWCPSQVTQSRAEVFPLGQEGRQKGESSHCSVFCHSQPPTLSPTDWALTQSHACPFSMGLVPVCCGPSPMGTKYKIISSKCAHWPQTTSANPLGPHAIFDVVRGAIVNRLVAGTLCNAPK